jgi:dihydroorotate dehydrogenase (NAD+) catalytic subunit
MLASGILGYAAETLEIIERGGAGAVVTKSFGVKPRKGYANPTIVQTGCGLINAMGLPNPGISEFVKEIREAKKALNVPLIVSIYGFEAEEYATVAKKLLMREQMLLSSTFHVPMLRRRAPKSGRTLRFS